MPCRGFLAMLDPFTHCRDIQQQDWPTNSPPSAPVRHCFTGKERFARLMDMASFAKAKAQKKEKGEEISRITSRDNRWLRRFRACLGGEEGGDGIVGLEGVRLVEAGPGSAV